MSNKPLDPDSSSDDSMDWTDNLGGMRELYGEGGTADSQGTSSGAQNVEPPTPPEHPRELQSARAAAEAAEAQHGKDPVGQPLEGPAAVPGGVQQPPEGLAPPPPHAGGEGDAEDGATGDSTGMAVRARAFVEKKLEESVQILRKDLGERQLGYEAVLAIRKRDLATKHLLGGEPAAMPDVGSFVSTADRRLLKTTLEVSVGQRRATSTSFDPQRLTCHCLGPHNGFKLAGGGGYRAGREAILLTDQAYPPMLEATGVRRCIKMVRIEHGMLIELADALLDMLRGRYIAAGSIVLLFSASNLAVAGTSGYCADLMGASRS
jgi:hypothetical protein